jgi:DNA/RNA endonuclease YhcR with UshA esterase domain
MRLALDPDIRLTVMILLLAMIGMAAVYVAAQNIEPQELEVYQVKDAMDGKVVVVTAPLCKIRKMKTGSVFWSIGDEAENVTVPLLDARLRLIPAMEGDIVSVTGLISEYNGEMEIVPKDISVVDSVVESDMETYTESA